MWLNVFVLIPVKRGLGEQEGSRRGVPGACVDAETVMTRSD